MDDSKIIEIISKTANIDQNKITLQTTINDLDIDSLDIMELILTFEDELGIEISDDEIKHIQTIQDIVDYLNKKS